MITLSFLPFRFACCFLREYEFSSDFQFFDSSLFQSINLSIVCNYSAPFDRRHSLSEYQICRYSMYYLILWIHYVFVYFTNLRLYLLLCKSLSTSLVVISSTNYTLIAEDWSRRLLSLKNEEPSSECILERRLPQFERQREKENLIKKDARKLRIFSIRIPKSFAHNKNLHSKIIDIFYMY